MPKLLDRCWSEDTCARYAEPFRLSFEDRDITADSMMRSLLEQHELKVNLSVRYNCTPDPAGRTEGYEYAKELLRSVLYDELLVGLNQIQSLVYSKDYYEAMKAISNLKAEIRGIR